MEDKYLAPVVQKVDNAIHRINHYPMDSAIEFWIVIYPADSAIHRLNNCMGPGILKATS